LAFIALRGKENIDVKVLSMLQSGELTISSPLAFAEGLFSFL